MIITGGSDDAVAKVREMLPRAVSEKIMGSFHAEMFANVNDVFEKVKPVISETESMAEKAVVSDLLTAAGKGQNAVIGIEDVLNALQEGRIMKLIFIKDFKDSGYACRNCRNLSKQKVSVCPYCKGGMEDVNYLIDLAAQRAVEQGSQIEVITENKELSDAGGIGSLSEILMSEIYLETTPLNEAIEKWLRRLEAQGFLKAFPGEKVMVSESLGRITAEPVTARLSSPFYHSSAMDGYAVKHQETFGASETSLKKLKLGEQSVYVDTGDPMPDDFNAVLMIEDVNVHEGHIEITEPATPWQNVRVIGEDIVATELILPENHRIRHVDVGAMLAGGYVDINVRRKPKVVIIPTGTEIVEPGTNLKRGDIIEYNSRVLGGLVSEWGGEAVRFRIIPDNIEELKNAILEAHKVGDMIVVNAGASSGSEDFTSRAISETGEIIFHGVSIKPGKPVMAGIVRNKPVLGIPGYPVSAFITFNLFGKPVIYRWQGIEMAPLRFCRQSFQDRLPQLSGRKNF